VPPITHNSQPITAAPGAAGLVLAGDRPAAVVDFEAAMVDFFVDAADLFGVPRSLAAIYGIVFAAPAPLSFAEIAARLDLSQGSISQGLRALRDVGAVVEVSTDADSTDLFAVDTEMRQLIGRFLKSRVERQLNGDAERLAGLKTRLAALPAADRKKLSPRLQKLQRWHDRTRRLLPLVRAFLQLPGGGAVKS
jgi:DNA-binding transcriptional regulator GbsR (MarR family)